MLISEHFPLVTKILFKLSPQNQIQYFLQVIEMGLDFPGKEKHFSGVNPGSVLLTAIQWSLRHYKSVLLFKVIRWVEAERGYLCI